MRGIFLTTNLKEKLLDIKSAFCNSPQYLFKFFAFIRTGDRRAETLLNLHAVKFVLSYFIKKMNVSKVLCNPTNINPLNPELNPICYLLALLGAHHFLHVSRIRVKLLTFRLLVSYIYGAPILDVSRSHTTTQHSR